MCASFHGLCSKSFLSVTSTPFCTQDALTHSVLISCKLFSAHANEIPANSCHMYLVVYAFYKAVRTNSSQPKLLDTFLEGRLNRLFLVKTANGNQRSIQYSSLGIKSRGWDCSVPLGHL